MQCKNGEWGSPSEDPGAMIQILSTKGAANAWYICKDRLAE